MDKQDRPSTRPRGRKGKFAHAGGLISAGLRRAGEKRGFAETRLLTQWAEIAGQEIAAIARPTRVRYGQGGFGATLTLCVEGAHGPTLEMQLPQLRERINACYGYNAIARIRLVQTAETGFAEPAAPFAPAPGAPGAEAHTSVTPRTLTEEQKTALSRATDAVADKDLRTALQKLGSNVLTRRRP
ncbi:MAG: DciA family protein [Pseudomonadota bacterium]